MRLLVAGWAAPIIVASLVYGVAYWGGALAPTSHRTPGTVSLVEQTIGITLGLTIPTLLFEELGWRGFLVPELAKFMSFGAVAIVSGVVWALFHYPFLLAPDYATVPPTLASMVVFTVAIIAASFPLAWLRLRSGSVWPAVLFHAAHNAFVNDVLGKQVQPTGRVNAVFFGESGVGLAIGYSLLAVWCWRHRAGLAVPDLPADQGQARVRARVGATVRAIRGWHSPHPIGLPMTRLRSAVTPKRVLGALLLLVGLPHLVLAIATPDPVNLAPNIVLAALAASGGWLVTRTDRLVSGGGGVRE